MTIDANASHTTIGLLIARDASHPARVRVNVIGRDEGKDHPRNFITHDALNDLGMHGFVSDLDGEPFIGFEPEYYDVYSVNQERALAMFRTLSRYYVAPATSGF